MQLLSYFSAMLLLLGLFPIQLQAQDAQLLYFTDGHQFYELDDVPGGRGGLARLKYLSDSLRKDDPNLISIHGGDFVGGVLYGGLYKGLPMISGFNKIPIDIFNFGQHEFDYGEAHLKSLIDQSNGQFFSSNLLENKQGDVFYQLPKTLQYDTPAGRLLFIGLTDQLHSSKASGNIIQKDLITATQEILASLKDSLPVDFIILLSQCDLETNKRLARSFPEISLILTEEVQEYDSQIDYSASTPIVATAGNMSSAARIQLHRDKTISIDIIPLDSKLAKDPIFQKLEQNEKDKVQALLSETLAELAADLNVRDGLIGESLAGNLICDAFQEEYQTDLALIDGSGIRVSVEKGPFSRQKLRQLLPFGNKILRVELSGRQLKDFINSQLLADKPKLIQVAGFSYLWDKSTGQVHYNGINDEQTYSLALNDYNFQKLPAYSSLSIAPDSPKALADYQLLENYLKKHPIILPKLSGRITIIESLKP